MTGDVLATVQKLADAGALTKWGAALADSPQRRSTMLGELRMVGIKQPEKIAQVSVRNDAAFLFSVVGSTSVIAVVLGQLPGDWGFFGSYLTGGHKHWPTSTLLPLGGCMCMCRGGRVCTARLLHTSQTTPMSSCPPALPAGGITLVVLAIGSINPGILQFAIDQFRQATPRLSRHLSCHSSHATAPHGYPPAPSTLPLLPSPPYAPPRPPFLPPSPLCPALLCCSQVVPDYTERVVRHEAAHFLTGYLLGVPVANYSLTLGKEHTDFAEAKLQASVCLGGPG